MIFRTFLTPIILFAPVAGCNSKGLADRLMLHPTTAPAYSDGTPGWLVCSGGRKLQAFSTRTQACDGREPAAFVLVLGGNEDRAEWTVSRAAEAWRDEPVEVVAVNYPGYGQTTGPAMLCRVARAAVDAYDALSVRASGRPIFVQANSLGASAALSLGATRPVTGLVLQNAFPLREVLVWYYGWWNLWLVAGPAADQIPLELDALSNAVACRCNSVFVLPGADLVAPPCFQRQVVSRYGGDHREVRLPWAHHNAIITGPKLDELRQQIRWLTDRSRNS